MKPSTSFILFSLSLSLFSKEAYLKIMETVTEQGLDYLTRERRRVQNLLQSKVSSNLSHLLQTQ